MMGEWDADGDSDSVTALREQRKASESIGRVTVRPNAPGVDEWFAVVKLIADTLPDGFRVGGGAKGDVLRLRIVRTSPEGRT